MQRHDARGGHHGQRKPIGCRHVRVPQHQPDDGEAEGVDGLASRVRQHRHQPDHSGDGGTQHTGFQPHEQHEPHQGRTRQSDLHARPEGQRPRQQHHACGHDRHVRPAHRTEMRQPRPRIQIYVQPARVPQHHRRQKLRAALPQPAYRRPVKPLPHPSHPGLYSPSMLGDV